MSYLADDTRLDLKNHKGPSTPMACDFCAGIIGTYALKILLNRGKVLAAPKSMHFDAYRNKFLITWRPWGNNNLMQKISLMLIRNKLKGKL